MFKGDPKQSTRELLDEIKAEAVRGAQEGNLTYLMPALTALFVKLSDAAKTRAKNTEAAAERRAKAAEASARELERLTRWIIGLTILLVIFALPLVADVIEKHWPFR